jgi:HlyD family secretion protein
MVQVGAQVSGTVSELPVDFNSVVRSGEVVARLDPSVYRSRLQAAQAALQQAVAQAAQMQTALDDAERKRGRAEELYQKDLITQAELDTARIARDQAAADLRGGRAAITSAQAGVKQAQVDLDRTVIRSPIDGVVVDRQVDVGQTLAATFQSPILFTIADLRTMHLLTEVDEGEIGGISRGSTVSFRVEASGSRVFEGSISEVRLQPYAESTAAVATSGASGSAGAASVATTGTAGGSTTGTNNNATSTNPSASGSSGPAAPGAVTYTAVVDVSNPDGLLAPGATAIVTLEAGARRDVVRVPNKALSFSPSPAMLERTGQTELSVQHDVAAELPATDRRKDVRQVWRFEKGRFVPVDVVTGISDDRWTELVDGSVRPGDQLVTGATPF